MNCNHSPSPLWIFADPTVLPARGLIHSPPLSTLTEVLAEVLPLSTVELAECISIFLSVLWINQGQRACLTYFHCLVTQCQTHFKCSIAIV